MSLHTCVKTLTDTVRTTFASRGNRSHERTLTVERDALFMGERVFPIVAAKITGIDIDDRDTFEIAKALIEMRALYATYERDDPPPSD